MHAVSGSRLSKAVIAAIALVLLGVVTLWVAGPATPSRVTGAKPQQLSSDEKPLHGHAADESASTEQTAAAQAVPRPAGVPMLTVPSHFRFAGIDAVPSAASMDELLSYYGKEDRDAVLRFVATLPDLAYRFENEAQLEWMIQAGFPMPDDILAAQQLDDEALFAEAERGNFKAAFLSRQRQLSKRIESGAPASATDPEWVEASQRKGALTLAMLRSGSPFTGYLEATQYRIDYPDELSATAGPLMWAALKGDYRAARSNALNGVDASTATLYLMGMVQQERCVRTTAGRATVCPVRAGDIPHFPPRHP